MSAGALWSALAAVTWLVGCSVDSSPTGAGGFGATPGGVKDMSLAREYVRNGRVPPPEAFLVEGMFSEHDLPLEGTACTAALCLRGAMGVAPDLDGTPSAWMQVGMSSAVDPESFQRAPQALVLTVDVSGSMGWSYSREERDYPTPGALTRHLLLKLLERLGPEDRVALVTYGSQTRTVLDFVPGDDPRLSAAVEGLEEAGSTNMEAGLRRAYSLAAGGAGGRSARVMLFTDVQPNVGVTEATDFQRIVEEGAGQGVGLTVFGVGIGMGPEVFSAMSHLRGGNAFSLATLPQADALLEESWPWMVSPIAHALTLQVAPPEGFRVVQAYGFPGNEGGTGASLDVASVFLSRRRGALLLRLVRDGEGPLWGLQVGGELRYTTLEGSAVTDSLVGEVPAEPPSGVEVAWFAQHSVGKSVALALLVSGMREAAEQYAGAPQAAAEHMRRVHERFAADAAALEDPALEPELQLAERLLALMREGAPQESFYGAR
jgi:Ca-activated chloride channel homolog